MKLTCALQADLAAALKDDCRRAGVCKDGRAVARAAAEVRVRAGAPRGVEVIVELDVVEPGRVALEPPSLQGLAGVQAQA